MLPVILTKNHHDYMVDPMFIEGLPLTANDNEWTNYGRHNQMHRTRLQRAKTSFKQFLQKLLR